MSSDPTEECRAQLLTNPVAPLSYKTVELDVLVERALEVTQGRRMVFFLGAGASRAAPSCLPMPEIIQRAVFDQVVPRDADNEELQKEKDLIADSLPEIYHEILLHLGGQNAREIWRCLTFWESVADAPSLASYELAPNLVHLLTVYLAWRSGTPLITVNFDQMLERAGSRLALEVQPNLNARTTAESVAIWKLHGSVDNTSSIRTTLQSITASAPRELHAIRREFERGGGCLIGYSGRDIDFFPFLCNWRAGPIYWLNLDFTVSAIKRFWTPFNAVEGLGAEEWARRVIKRLPHNDTRTAQLKAELGREPLDEAAVSGAYVAVIAEHARRIYEPMFVGQEAKRVLVHALALASIGQNRRAWKWIGRFFAASYPPELECRAQLLRSALAHEFSKYVDSEAYARQALQIAHTDELGAEMVEATLRAAEARRMAYFARFPFVGLCESLDTDARATIRAMAAHAWKFRKLRRLRKEDRSASPNYDRLRASFEYLEHLVRFGALIQGLVEHLLPPRVTGVAMRPFWRWLERRSARAGYAFGIGNAKKFRLRGASSKERDEDVLSAFGVYDLVSAPTGLAIDRRDRADAACKQMARLPAGPERDKQREEALALYDEARCWANYAQNASLELKILVGMKNVDPFYSPRSAEVNALLDKVQGPAYERLRQRIFDALAS